MAPSLTLGDGSNRQRHGDLEVVDGTSDPGASVDGIIEMSDVDDPHSNADQRDDLKVDISLNAKIVLTATN